LKIGELASRIQFVYPGVEQIRRAPSGRITAHWFENGATGAAIIDPKTGRGVAAADPNEVQRWLTSFHRSLLLGDGGRVAMAMGAFAMLVISLSGIVLLARCAGGWRHILAPPQGSIAARLHVEIARISVLGLALSSITALWMAAETLDMLTIESDQTVFQAAISGKSDVALDLVMYKMPYGLRRAMSLD
jgi:sulfite reductase (NADPH) flavoprotein alpha-component